MQFGEDAVPIASGKPPRCGSELSHIAVGGNKVAELVTKCALVSVAEMQPFHFGGTEILPARVLKSWSWEMDLLEIPVASQYTCFTVLNQARCWAFAGIHGDELNGVSVVHHLIHGDDHIANTDDDTINRKTFRHLICVPVVNIEGMLLEQRGAPDNRDINRLFPGKQNGNQSQRIAHALFEGVVSRADYLIDLHSAPHSRTNLPHVRADFDKKECLELARAFGTQIILHSSGPKGSLRREASAKGTDNFAGSRDCTSF